VVSGLASERHRVRHDRGLPTAVLATEGHPRSPVAGHVR
jgi:hypothetical protein